MTTEIRPPAAHQRPSGRLYLSANQLNLVHGRTTLVELDAIAAGFTDGIENTATHRITPGYAGFYGITGVVTFTNVVADKPYAAYLFINTSTYVCANVNHAALAYSLSVPVSALAKLTATDYITLKVRSFSGDDTVDIFGSPHYTFLCVQRVR